MQKLAQVDETWTLFLDRDGVINERIFDGYILDYTDFHFKEAILEHASTLFAKFARVIVVTNQQCVAKGLISLVQLEELHERMKEDFERSGAKIAAVFAATERKGEEPFMRKPHRKMADLAKDKFPEIDFSKSIMVGDTDADIQFGKNLGMKTVLIRSEEKISSKPDLSLTRLVDLIQWI